MQPCHHFNLLNLLDFGVSWLTVGNCEFPLVKCNKNYQLLPNITSLSPFLRYFVLDPELGQLQYFLNEQSKTQKPRGSLPLLGSSVAPSDEFPFMFTVYAVNGELFKLRGKIINFICFWSFISALSSSHSFLLAPVIFTFLCCFPAVTHSLSSLLISFETSLSAISRAAYPFMSTLTHGRSLSFHQNPFCVCVCVFSFPFLFPVCFSSKAIN